MHAGGIIRRYGLMEDEIIKEIHKYREEFAAKFNYDIKAMFEYLREQQQKSGRKYVSFSNKKDEAEKDEDVKKAA